jgi:hypothetical protein
MDQTVEKNAAALVDGVTDIIKRYEAQWQKTGEKYNLFKVAGIERKELIMCRVLADLMNPQGKQLSRPGLGADPGVRTLGSDPGVGKRRSKPFFPSCSPSPPPPQADKRR